MYKNIARDDGFLFLSVDLAVRMPVVATVTHLLSIVTEKAE
jgi:hypothetical protein